MSIFEKIKQFFKNIGNKQKLLESPKEIREEMSEMVSSSKKESKFLEDIKFDPKDLLDPRVCNGKDLVPNILRTLGANEDVIKNPQLIEEIRVQFQGIANQSGIEMPNYYEQPTRETINAIVEAVKTNGILTSQDRYNKYARLGLEGHEVYNGISIDKETGAVTLQRFVMSGREAHVLDGNYMHETTFTPDGNGNAVENSTSYDIDTDTLTYEARLSGTSEVLYNPDGIAMKLESKSYKQEDGQDILQYHAVNTRDEQYPFIAQKETIVNDFGHGSPVGTEYIAIEMKDLSQLGFPEYQKDENGRTTPITFDDRAQISKYYQDNKEAIDNALMQEPDHGLFPSKGLKQSLKAGIKKLAIKAGILPNEHEQETEIAE